MITKCRYTKHFIIIITPVSMLHFKKAVVMSCWITVQTYQLIIISEQSLQPCMMNIWSRLINENYVLCFKAFPILPTFHWLVRLTRCCSTHDWTPQWYEAWLNNTENAGGWGVDSHCCRTNKSVTVCPPSPTTLVLYHYYLFSLSLQSALSFSTLSEWSPLFCQWF